MKYIRHIIALTIFLTISFCCYLLYKMHLEEEKKLNEQVGEIFWKAIHKDSDLRLDELNVPWVNITASENPPGSLRKGGGIIRSSAGEEFIPYSEIERPPKHLRSLFMDQSFLNTKNPLSAIRLDSMFKAHLTDLLPDAATLVYCYNWTKNTVEYSDPDTLLSKSRIASPWIKIGMKHELLLRAYVEYPLQYMLKALWYKSYPFLFVVFLLLGMLGYFYYKMKKVSNPVILQNDTDEKKNKLLPSADSIQTIDDQPFYFRGKRIVSTNQNLLIFKLFLTKPEHTLEHQEIISALWGDNLFEYHQRLRKCMQRFREFLGEEFPEAELVSIKGKGYRLYFPYEDELPVTAPEQEDRPV